MSKITMLLSNPFRPDARVLKEAEGLQSKGHTLTILAWDRKAEFPQSETLPSGVQIIRVQKVISNYGIGIAQLLHLPRFWISGWKHLKQLNPDIIHCHDFDTLPLGLTWGKTHHKPVVYDAHEYYADMMRPRLKGMIGALLYHAIQTAEEIGARSASAVITVDETLGKKYRRLNAKVLVIGHFPPLAFTDHQANPFSDPAMTMIYSGRLSRDRGLEIMADILKELRSMGIPARLLLLGAFIPAQEEEDFHQYAMNITEWIEFMGWVNFESIPHVLSKADVGLAILTSEPRYVAATPVKLFEYMAVGLPVVASDFPLIHQIIKTDQCGLLVNPEADPAGIAHQIAEWWNNPEGARQMGKRGRQAVMGKYNFEMLISELDTLYRNLISNA